MDHGTNWTYAEPLPRRSAESVLLMIRKIICNHGKMLEVLTDNGEEFQAYSFKTVLARHGIQHVHTTPYHPQTNGRLEKFNDTLVLILAHYLSPTRQNLWDQYLPDALLAYRAHHSRTLGTSPFYMLYSCEPRLPSDSTYGTIARPPTSEELHELHRRR